MSHSTSSLQTTIRDEQGEESNTRLHGRRLVLARVFWLVIAIFELAALVYSVTGAAAQLQVLCTTSCTIQQLSATAVLTLQHVALSLGVYIAFYLAVILIMAVLCYTVAAILIWRKSNDWMALLVSLMLMSFGPGLISNGVRFSQWFGPTVAPHVSSLFDQINLLILVLVFYPRFTSDLGSSIAVVLFPVILFSLIIAPFYRYRRVSTPSQRQQTKWVVYSLVVSITSVIALIPIAFAIAILRYRLWDIDIIINRTLVYGTLTAILALVYFGLIFVLQNLLRGIINQNNDVAIVVSTLTIAALFQPLRHSIQQVIDRRFYGRKYDAARILAAFNATLRNEVDLDDLSRHLIAVVEETVQPEHVSLWLRKSDKERHTNNQV